MQTQLFFNTDFLKNYQDFEKIIWIDFEFVRSSRDNEMFELDPYLIWLKTKYGLTDRKDNKVWVELMKFKNDGSMEFKKLFKEPQQLKLFLNSALKESTMTRTLEQRLSLLEKRVGIRESEGNNRTRNRKVSETLRGDVSSWNIKTISFRRFEELMERSRSEGIVLLGAGGDANEWINGVSEMLFDEEVSTTKSPSELFRGAYLLKTSGGRSDIALIFNKPFPANLGRMAMWRLKFGDCSWVSDYLVNYKKQH